MFILSSLLLFVVLFCTFFLLPGTKNLFSFIVVMEFVWFVCILTATAVAHYDNNFYHLTTALVVLALATAELALVLLILLR